MKKSIAILFVLLLIAGTAYARMTVIGIAGMVAAPAGGRDWTFVQTDGADPGTTSVTTIAISLVGVAAGNLIGVVVGWDADTAHRTCSVKDDLDNAFSAGGQARSSGTSTDMQTFYILSAASGNRTYTATFSGSVSYPMIVVWEYSYDGTATYDTSVADVQGGSTSWTTTSFSTDGEALVLAGALSWGESVWSAHAIGGAAATATNVSSYAQGWRRVQSVSAGAATITEGNGGQGAIAAIAFK